MKGGGVMRRILAVMFLALLLAGCAAPAEKAPASSPAVSAVRAMPAPEVENMSSSMVESSARPIPEEEVLAAYERAERIYGWFDLAPLPSSGQPFVLNGRTYYPVDMEGVGELEDLRTYLRGVFSQEVADRLLDGKTPRILYQDVNGILCVSGEGREHNAGKGQIRVEAEQLEETLYSVNVMVELLGEDGETVVGLESWSFPYAFVNDRWVFTDFRLVY